MPTRSVALITYHAAHNNGSFLQAYATQRKIQQLGYDCDIINSRRPGSNICMTYTRRCLVRRTSPRICMSLSSTTKLIQRRHNDFTNLMHSALQLTPKFYEDLSQMGDLETQYDVFVSGSDQIWNMDAWDYSDAYFLSFVHHKPKVSYASSMGGHILDKRGDTALANHYRTLLADYQPFPCERRLRRIISSRCWTSR